MHDDSEARVSMNIRCATRGCDKETRDNHGFCSRCANVILGAAKAQVRQVLDVASEVYIGRSSHPECRLLQHFCNGCPERNGRDHLLVVHWAAQWNEIEHFEEELIKHVKQSGISRLANRSLESDGWHSGSWEALYVSFRLKDRYDRIPGATIVKELHWRNRLWPDPIVPNSPVLLRCGLCHEEAVAELKRFKEPQS